MAKKTYKLGCSAALSGCEEVHGKAMLTAVELAVEQANQEGLPFTLELESADDKGETEAGKNVAKKFIDDPLVMGVVGPMNSNPAIGAAPIYNQNSLVHITNSASNVVLSEKGYRTFFRMIPNDYVQADALINFIKNYLKASTVTVINDDTDFSSGLASLVLDKAKKANLQIIDHMPVVCEKGDYSDEISAINVTGPEVIFFAILEPEGKLISRQLREAGNRSIFLGTDALKPSKFLLTPGYDVPGPYHSCATTDIIRESSAAKFAEAFEKKYGEKYSIYTAEAYDAARIIINAINNCSEPNRESVLNEVAQTKNFTGATGNITFTSNGELADPRLTFYFYENEELQFLGYSDQFD